MSQAAVADNVKSLTVVGQVIRADGTREAARIYAYMDRDPDRMQAVLDGKVLPETVGEKDGIFAPQKVSGAITHGKAVLAMLNGMSEADAERVTAINARQARGLVADRRPQAAASPLARLWARVTRS